MKTPEQDAPQTRWRIELLGGLRARCNDREIERFQTRKTALLLAYLAYPPQRRHSREELIDLLWPEAEPEAGRNRLSQAVVWLRPQLEPAETARGGVLLADRWSVGLNPQAVATDVGEFEAALHDAEAPAGTRSQLPALQKAVALYQGDLLPGHYENWVLTERRRLHDLFLSASRRLVLHYEQAQEYTQALDYARRALAAEPLAEELHCDLIRLLAADGQPEAALRCYRGMERLLAEELNETPAAASRALIEQIRRSERPATVPPAQRGRVAPPPASTPPTFMTRFFGREAEIAQIEAQVQSTGTRLVTLTGTGGAGKTRLAIEATARLRKPYHGAIWFVPLADLSDARLVLTALIDLMRLPRSSAVDPLEQVVNALSQRPSLLVLDNCEHLLEGIAPLLRDLLERIPTLTALVTSRQRLGLEGEREISTPPLATPAEALQSYPAELSLEQLTQIDSVRLFVDRAQAVRPAFAITPGNAAAVAQLCERLEGLPLAIELCAAWAQVLTPAQMLARLTRRFDLLVSRRADIPPRHRTLRAALEYSYLLLPPNLQQFFIRLAVFRGGWTLEAAEAICGESLAAGTPAAVLEVLTELRERSMITADETEGGAADAEMRYRMLESLREFAAEQQTLAVEAPLRRRHADYFLQLAEAAEPHMSGPEQAAWVRRLEAEHDNLRAALAWSLEEGKRQTEGRREVVEAGLRIAVALGRFWDVRGYLGEGQDWLERLLASPVSKEGENLDEIYLSVRAKALNVYGQLARGRTEFAAAAAAAQEALHLWSELGNKEGMAVALQLLATLAYSREDYDAARGFSQEGLRLARELGDAALIASALLNLGNIAMELCEWPQAWALYSESLELQRSERSPQRIAAALNNLGLVARYQGDLAAAWSLLTESLAIDRDLSDRSGTAVTLLNLGTVHRLAGRFGEARSSLEEAATLAFEVDNKRALAWCVKELGHLACAEQDYERGMRLLSASESLRLTLGMSFKPTGPEELARDTALARAALGETGLAAARTAGSGLSLTESFTLAVRTAENRTHGEK